MKLAIHETNIKGFFSKRWIEYCKAKDIPFKIVNCYSTDIINDLADCDGLLWHFSHAHPIDFQIAIKLIASLDHAGKKSFPNINACWHFDDKVAQKYLLEAISAPLIKSWVFYSKKDAFKWISETSFPKVFKLKGGAGSANVVLIQNMRFARKYVRKAFGKGFRQFDRINLFRYSLKQLISGKSNFKKVVLQFLKIFFKSDYEKVKGKESGYVYFQQFIPNNNFDIRIIVIGERAFGIKRMVRKNDFRASGSGQILYEKSNFDERCVKISFEVARKLNSNCLTFDFLFDEKNLPLISEISYGFYQEGYDNCPGYWDSKLSWHEGNFIPQHWMVEDLIKSITNK